MSNNHKHTSRRDFLQLLGMATTLPMMQSPLQILIQSIVAGASQSSWAADNALNPRRYLQIIQEGAPPRWVFDLFLTPYDKTGFVANAGVGTQYAGNSLNYVTVAKNGINVPYLWNFNVPRAGGGTRPMSDLLQNMLALRGIYVGNPDHGAAQALSFMPLGAGQSMPALAGDASNAPIPAISAGVGQYKYLSTKAKAPIVISSNGNMLNSLLNPFNRKDPNGTFSTKRKDLGAALDASINALNLAAEAQAPNSKSISSSTTAAKDLLSAGFGNLTQIWNDLNGKYSSIVSRALDPAQNALPGINDKSIATDGTNRFQLNGTVVNLGDIRTMITSSTGVYALAAHFAMAEYVLTNNLSFSISISPGSIYNISANGNQYLGQDEHGTSGMISMILNSQMNLAYAGCLLELIDQLKAKNIFNETVITMGGEFGRSPRKDGTGSDHGYKGGAANIYCGALNGPLVLGNIYNNRSQDYDDGGTWGLGAPVAELGKPLDLGHWASTLAFMLRVPSNVTASNSLLANQGGGFIPLIEKAKQVA